MTTLRSFQMRLLLWSWALLLGTLAVVFVYSSTIMGNELVTETKTKSWKQIENVRWLIKGHQKFDSTRDFSQWVTTLAQNMGIRITYIVDGKVVTDSEVNYDRLDQLDDHSGRPEVVAAIEDGRGMNQRYSKTLGTDMIYVATNMKAFSGLPAGVLRLAVPFSQVQARLNALRDGIFWVMLLAIAIAAIITALLSRIMSKSISALAETARIIGSGDYSQRIRAVPGGEFRPLAEAVNTMAKRIERHISTIEEQKNQLGAMFEGMREGVMSLDTRGRLEACNRALTEMLPVPETAIGRTPLEVTRRLEIQDMVDDLRQDGSDELQAIILDLPDGRILEVTGMHYFDQEGVRKIILMFHDITLMKQSEQSLRDFVANASHQLRTPLTSIKGYAETLIDSPPTDFSLARGFLEIVVSNADHMSKVISSMLALAKSEQMGKTLELAPLSARDVYSQAAADISVKSAERGIHVESELGEEELLVMAEKDGLLHVFHNLMHNALKYSPDNSIITVSSSIEEAGWVIFCVEDQGPGVPRGYSERVFERFYRVDENTIDGQGGAGLGLAICRRIVTNFGGEIWHDGPGRDDVGARFCFKLKAGAAE